MATGNIRISELTHLGQVLGTERIPVSQPVAGTTYYESFSMGAYELSTYVSDVVNTRYSLDERLTSAYNLSKNAYIKAEGAVESANSAINTANTAYSKAQSAYDTSSAVQEAIEEAGGTEQFIEALDKAVEVTSYANELGHDIDELNSTVTALTEPGGAIATVTSYANTIGAEFNTKGLKGYVKNFETASGDVNNFVLDRELQNGEQYTRIILNNTEVDIVVALSTNSGYYTPNGYNAEYKITIKAGAYGEFNFMKNYNQIFVRAI